MEGSKRISISFIILKATKWLDYHGIHFCQRNAIGQRRIRKVEKIKIRINEDKQNVTFL